MDTTHSPLILYTLSSNHYLNYVQYNFVNLTLHEPLNQLDEIDSW